MDIRTYFNQRAAHWDDGEQSVDQIRRMIAFLSDIQEGMSVLMLPVVQGRCLRRCGNENLLISQQSICQKR